MRGGLVAEAASRAGRVCYIAVVGIALVLRVVRFDAVMLAVIVGVAVEVVGARARAGRISKISLRMLGNPTAPRRLAWQDRARSASCRISACLGTGGS